MAFPPWVLLYNTYGGKHYQSLSGQVLHTAFGHALKLVRNLELQRATPTVSHERNFRSGDIWLAHSRRYADLKQALFPIEAAKATPRLTVPFEPDAWITDRKARLADGIARLAKAARSGSIPCGSIENGVLKIDWLSSAVPKETDEMVLDLYDRLPAICITREAWIMAQPFREVS